MFDIQALKSTLDIVAVLVARGVKLVRKGTNYLGQCIFHKDSSPSLSVNPEAQLWSCFGCGAGGDVFSFVMKQEGISFFEAVKKLCKLDIQEKDLEQLNREREDAHHEGAVDRPSQVVLDRVVAHWQAALARTPKAQGYLKARGLWKPELLRALKIGYSSGSLARALPGGGKLRRQLTEMGILNKKGNETFWGRLLCPIYSAGVLVSVYGRTIQPDSEVAHLYLKGPRRGVFNPAGLAGSGGDVILTEALLDAVSLLSLGYGHVTSSYGVTGFTPDLKAALLMAKVQRVFCVYDADPAGDQAAEQLAHTLANHEIEVRRVVLPEGVKDPNDFLKAGGTREEFQALLDGARPLLVARTTATTNADPPTAPAPAVAPTPPAAGDVPPPPPASGVIAIARGPRVYELVLLPQDNPLSLRVRMKVRHGGRTFIDTLNLYSDRARLAAVARIAPLFGPGTKPELIEEDLFSLVEELEAWVKAGEPADGSPASTVPETERAPAMAFLEASNLADIIREDLTHQGVVGENSSKLLVYFVATSRRLPKPLSLCVVSRSSGGKSFIVSKVCELMPPEEHFGYTRVSSKALFHDETNRLCHKLLTVEEVEGMEEAAYALRVMQSNQMLRNLSTITDPVTGKHKASENIVHGPVALIVTTTKELDFETESRAFVISVDESKEQTERIHERQRFGRTLEGLGARHTSQAIVRKHQNAQRLLKSLEVVNPFAQALTFPSGTLRLRREQEKYLTLIEAITFLFQYQREQGVYAADDGSQIPYVLTAPADIDLANELVVASLRQAFEEVTTPSRELLRWIRKMVNDPEMTGLGRDGQFSRRQLREYTGWSDYQVRIHLKQLEELEFVHAITGSFGREYVYTLTPDHRLALDGDRPLDEEIRELGLTRAKDLKKGRKA